MIAGAGSQALGSLSWDLNIEVTAQTMAFLGAFTARIAFTPAGANETGMAVGDKILLLEKNDGGWWLVHKWVNGQVQRPPGWVPSNYLTEVSASRRLQITPV